MINSELLQITELLKLNPNIPDLENSERTKIRRNITSLKAETELFGELEKDVLEKFSIPRETQEPNEFLGKLKESEPEKYKDIQTGLATLRKEPVLTTAKSESGEDLVKHFSLQQISEKEFWILVKPRDIKRGEQTFTFAMSGDEIDLLAKYLLKEDGN